MKSSISHSRIVRALMKKDLTRYGRNKLYLFLTALTLVLFVAIFWATPDTVDETITLGMAPPLQVMLAQGSEVLGALGVSPQWLEELEREDEGLRLIELDDAEVLRRVVAREVEVYVTPDGAVVLRDLEAGDGRPDAGERVAVDVGLAFPEAFIRDVARGQETTVTVIAEASVPPELRHAMESFVRELSYFIAGVELPVTLPQEETIILGEDRMGQQVSLRDRLRPLMALMILMVETYALASLISIEVLQRTVTALIVTPMRLWHFLLAKTLFGTGLALTQGMLIMALVGGVTVTNWSLVLVTLLMAALLFTGIAMFTGAAGKDFMDQLMYSMLFMIPMMIPAFSVLFPGTAATWVQIIPSYPVIDALVKATIYDATWADSLGALSYALVWVVVLFGMGWWVLKRKVETL